MKKHLLAAFVLLSSVTSYGGGYQLNMQGMRQLAMGGSGTAWPWDASTIFYNPGGLARLKNIQGYVGFGVVSPSTAFGSSMSSAVTIPQTMTPYNIYFGGPVQQDSKFALGLGVYSTAGMDVQWNDHWIGKYMVQAMRFQATMFQPTFSYRVGDFLSVGAGFVFGTGILDIRQALPYHGMNGPAQPFTDDGSMRLRGNPVGVGFNLGVQLKPSDNFQVGLTYRSQVNMGVSGGQATFSTPGSLLSSYPNTRFDAHIPIPQVASIGIGIRPTERLTLQLDLNYTGWNSFDSLKINFADHTDRLQDLHSPRHYRNTLTTRLGGNFKISKVVSVMAGGAYDPTPVTRGFISPDLPDGDRVNLSCGVTVRPLPRFTIIAAYEATTSVKRTGTYDFGGFTGTYKTQIATAALAVYYNF